MNAAIAANDGELITNYDSDTESGTGRVVAFVEPAKKDPIDQVYNDRLGRAPDGSGKEFWKTTLENDPDTSAAMAVLASDTASEADIAAASATVTAKLNTHFDAQPEVQAREADPENFEGVN